jgi:arylsulfatase A-like enzyme
VKAGGDVTLPTGHIDVAPTLAGLVGVSPSVTMKGRALVTETEPRSILAATRWPGAEIAVRDNRWKLVMAQAGASASLYDIVADPAERHDLAERHRDLAATLSRRAVEWRAHSNHLMENYAAIVSRHGRRCD